MAWPTRSKLLHYENRAPIVANTKYYSAAVPASHTWLVKDITLYVDDNAVKTSYVWHQHAGADLAIVSLSSGFAFGVAQTAARSLVLEAGDKIGYSVTTASTRVHFTVNGAELG